MNEARWEHGSDQHWIEPRAAATFPWTSCTLYGCGRYALDGLLRSVAIKRLWIPSFFCQEVVAALPRDQATLIVYPDRPDGLFLRADELSLQAGDAILIVNTLGLRCSSPALPSGVTLIEDHTHDLTSDWATSSTADYCVASLRKILPVPDGGVVWSPRGHALPPEPPLAPHHIAATLARLSAMLLKAAYLDGGAVEKASYRALALEGESGIASGPGSAISGITRTALGGFPVQRWRMTRAENFRAFCAALGELRPCRVLLPSGEAVPYVITLAFESQRLRDHVRARLIDDRIYPAILWSLEEPVLELPVSDIELSRRLLCVHCDHRYTAADMNRVADAIRRAISVTP